MRWFYRHHVQDGTVWWQLKNQYPKLIKVDHDLQADYSISRVGEDLEAFQQKSTIVGFTPKSARNNWKLSISQALDGLGRERNIENGLWHPVYDE